MGFYENEYEEKLLPDDACENPTEDRGLAVVETVGDFTRRFSILGGFKCSKAWGDGGDDSSHGISGARMWFSLEAEPGAVAWCIATGWYTRSTDKSGWHDRFEENYPEAWDLGYHARTQRYENQFGQDSCEHLGGDQCYYDGSSLNAMRFVPDFLTHPGKVWEMLENYYQQVYWNKEL